MNEEFVLLPSCNTAARNLQLKFGLNSIHAGSHCVCIRVNISLKLVLGRAVCWKRLTSVFLVRVSGARAGLISTWWGTLGPWRVWPVLNASSDTAQESSSCHHMPWHRAMPGHEYLGSSPRALCGNGTGHSPPLCIFQCSLWRQETKKAIYKIFLSSLAKPVISGGVIIAWGATSMSARQVFIKNPWFV